MSAPNLSDGNATVPTGKTLAITGGNIAQAGALTVTGGTVSSAVNATGSGNVILDGVAVNADATSNTTAKTTLKNVTVGNVTIEGANNKLSFDTTLTVSGTVTVADGASITAENTAKIVVMPGADVSALANKGLTFVDKDGNECQLRSRAVVTVDVIPPDTYTYDAANNYWNGLKNASAAAAKHTVTGITTSQAVTDTTNTNTFTVTSDKAEATDGETVTLSVKLEKAVPTDKKVTVTATSTVDTSKSGTATVTVGTSEATKYTVTVSGVSDYNVSTIPEDGYAAGATVTITLTQKTGTDMATDATVTAAGAPTSATVSVTKTGVAHKGAVEDSYETATVDGGSFNSLKDTLYVKSGDTYEKTTDAAYQSGTTYYTLTKGSAEVNAVQG